MLHDLRVCLGGGVCCAGSAYTPRAKQQVTRGRFVARTARARGLRRERHHLPAALRQAVRSRPPLHGLGQRSRRSTAPPRGRHRCEPAQARGCSRYRLAARTHVVRRPAPRASDQAPGRAEPVLPTVWREAEADVVRPTGKPFWMCRDCGKKTFLRKDGKAYRHRGVDRHGKPSWYCIGSGEQVREVPRPAGGQARRGRAGR